MPVDLPTAVRDELFGAGPVASAVVELDDPSMRLTMLQWIPWRAEGKLIFACVDPQDVQGLNDERIGEMISEQVAEEAVRAHNDALRRVDRA
jgi:hypothetical protein